MVETQYFKWVSNSTMLAILEVRHQRFEMLLLVSADKAEDVRKKMHELNSDGTYPNEETTKQDGPYARFIISSPQNWNCRWRDLMTILNELLGVYHEEYKPI